MRYLVPTLLLLTATTFAGNRPPRPKLPSGFYFDDRYWKILVVRPNHAHDETGARLDEMIGFAHILKTDPRYGTIEIVRGQDPDDEADTLYHELEHVIAPFDFHNQWMSGHRAMEKLAPMWVIIGANPPLAVYFRDVLKYEEGDPTVTP